MLHTHSMPFRDPLREKEYKRAYNRDWMRSRRARDPAFRDKQRASAAATRKAAIHRPDKWVRYAVTKVKSACLAAGIPFDLSPDDIAIPEVCPVTLEPLAFERNAPRDKRPSLDRLTPGLGYVKGNVRVLSGRGNRIKNDGTIDEHRRVVAYMARELEPDSVLHTEGTV